MQARFGLALSGGGFRASFFHLGVLRRLAELDLLRYVSTISTVSGGSIIGAHYYLLFKELFEAKSGKLEAPDFVQLVNQLEREFVDGNRADFRNRLFVSPGAHMRAIGFGRSYGRAMARLYAKHLYGPVTWRIYHDESYAAIGVPLHRSVILPREILEAPPADAEDAEQLLSSGYPGQQVSGPTLVQINEDAQNAVIPRLIINATCLNTGGPFMFAMNEVGGPTIGYIRTDEVFMLTQYKTLIARVRDSSFTAEVFAAAVAEALERGEKLQSQASLRRLPKTAFTSDGHTFPAATIHHLRFYKTAVERIANNDRSNREGKWYHGPPAKSRAIQQLSRVEAWGAVRRLFECDYGTLRRAKVHAWHLLNAASLPIAERGGTLDHEKKFREALSAIHEELPALLNLARRTGNDATSLVLDLYYLRNADNIDWTAPQELADLTLAQAVAASANFPPVFTPFRIFGLFSADRYDVVALTDGGINDNQGTEAVTADYQWLIASDAGGLVEAERDPPDARLPMMDRIINVLMGGLREAQLRSMHADAPAEAHEQRRPARRDPRKVHFHITDPLRDEGNEIPRELVAQIRTDLDAFNEIERSVLIRRGYLLTEQHVPASFRRPDSPFLALARPQRKNVPPPVRMTNHVQRILRGSSRRAGRLSEAYPALAAILAGIVATVLAVVRGDRYDTLRSALDYDLAEGAVNLEMFGPALSFIRDLTFVRWIVDTWRVAVYWAAAESLLGLALTGWVLYLGGRGLMQVLRENRRGWLLGRDIDLALSRTSAVFGLFRRVLTIITLICAFLFFATMRPKFLLGVLPLWGFPIAAGFAVILLVFTPLWAAAGSLSTRRPYRWWNSMGK